MAGDCYDAMTPDQKSLVRTAVDSLAKLTKAYDVETRVRFGRVFNRHWQVLWHVRTYADGVGWKDAHDVELARAVTMCLGMLRLALAGEK